MNKICAPARLSRRELLSQFVHMISAVSSGVLMVLSSHESLASAGGQAENSRWPTFELSEDLEGSMEPIRSGVNYSEDWSRPYIREDEIIFQSDGSNISAYESRFDLDILIEAIRGKEGNKTSNQSQNVTGTRLPLVLIAHDRNGLTNHVRRLARRVALDGRLACALDLFSREGGTEHIVRSERRSALESQGPQFFVQDILAAVQFYRSRPYADVDQVGVIGFGFGGQVAWRAVISMPQVRAAVCFYAPAPPSPDLARIRSAILGVYSSDPPELAGPMLDQLREALRTAGVTNRLIVLNNTQEGFFDEEEPTYSPTSAEIAWSEMSAWLRRYVLPS